ncbi:MAG: AmmeMemoRadiSam system protein A, partial [Clostridia bacterium]|nr:AmmeMemoRadiSam system protein A [Clostridia bacterium]
MSILSAYIVPHPPLIVPEVGRGGEKQIEKTRASYARVADEILRLDPETVVITSPHAVMYRDWFHLSPGKSAAGSFAQFRASGVRFEVRYDTELVREIGRLAGEEDFPAGTEGERDPALDHGT